MNISCEHDNSSHLITESKEVLELTATLFSAISDIPRLHILILLFKNQECCVAEIAASLNSKQNTVSMRLKKLYDANLVVRRRDGKHIFYSLKDEHVISIIRNAIEHVKH